MLQLLKKATDLRHLARRLALAAIVLIAPAVSWGQETVTIGDGTATINTNPIGTYYNYSITEQLYTADEIGMAGTISSISFYYMGNAAKDLPITVYMANVDAEDLSTGGISLADADEVFSGTLSVTTTAGWVTINLDSPFAYDGTSSLLIGCIKGYLYYFQGQTWQGTATASTMARYTQNDQNAYTTSTTPGNAQANRPNIQLEITASGDGPTCAKPDELTANGDPTSTEFSFDIEGGSGLYNIEIKAGNGEWTNWEYEWEETTVELTGLTPLTNYQVRVQSVCNDITDPETGEALTSGWKTLNFSTAAGIPLVETFGTSLPTNWALYNGLLSNVMNGTALSGTSYGWNFGTNNGVFDSHARVNLYGTSCNYWLVTPALTMEDNVQLTFDLALTAYSGTLAAPATSGTDDKFVVLITTDGGTTWEILRQWDNAGSEYVLNNIACTATGEAVAIDLSSYAGQSLAIAFYGESTQSNADNNLHIDNVSIDYIPTCYKPTEAHATVQDANNATISWTPNPSNADGGSYSILDAEYNPVAENLTGTSFALSDLEASHDYTYYVRTNCFNSEEDENVELVEVSFSTPADCATPELAADAFTNVSAHQATVSWTGFTSNNAYVVSYRFPAYIDGTSEDFNGSSNPTGWTFTAGALNADGTATLSGTSSWGINANNGVFDRHISMNMYSTKNYWLITPSMEIQDGYALNLDMAYTAYSGTQGVPAPNCPTHRFVILISIDDMTTWSILREWNNSGSEYVLDDIPNTGMNSGNIDLSAYAGQTAYIAFFGHSETSSYDNNFHFDNVTIGTLIPATAWQTVSPNPTATTTTITDLSAKTTYEVMVKGLCNGGAESEESDIQSFTTTIACPAPTTLAVEANTDDATTSVDLTWVMNGAETDWQLCINNDDENPIAINEGDVAITGDNVAYTLTGLTPGQGYTVKVRANCETSYTGDATSEWSNTVSFTTEATCLEPTDFAVDEESVEPHQAEFSWTAVGTETAWDIYYSTENTAPVNGGDATVGPITDNPYTLDQLDAATTYYVWVRAHCGDEAGEQSPWVGGVSFTTACEAITTFPWTENFEEYASGNLSAPCWVNELISGNGTQIFRIYTSANGSNSTHQLQLPDMSGGTLTKLVLPEMTLPNDNYQFVLDVYRSNSTYNDNYPNEGIRVYASTDGEIEGATELTFIPRQYNVSSTLIPEETATGWYTYEIPIGISGTCYIILRGESQYCTSTYMDNFVVEVAPTCRKPYALMLDNPSARTAHTATLKWTNGEEGQTAWQIAYSTNTTDFAPDNDFTPDGTTTWLVDANTNPFTINGLGANTPYRAYVRANCGTDDGVSNWSVLPANFTTLAGNLAPTAFHTIDLQAEQVGMDWTPAGNDNETSWTILLNDEDIENINDVEDVNLPGTASMRNAGSHPTVITGLTPEHTYYAWIRSNNQADGVSSWVAITGNTFTTTSLCPQPTAVVANDVTNNSATISWDGHGATEFTVSYRTAEGIDGISEEFSTTTIPTGWEDKYGLLSDVLNNDASLTTSSRWVFTNTNVFGAYHARLNIYGSSCNYWLITPEVILNDGANALAFDLALTDYNNADAIENPEGQADDKFAVLISTDDGTTWEILREWNNSGSEYIYNNIATAGEHVSLNLSSYSGAIKIAFYGESTESNGDNDLHIDNVAIGATIPAGEWVSVNAITNEASISPLDENTKYEVVVSPDCDLSIESTPVFFTTKSVYLKYIEANKWYAIASPMHNDGNNETLAGVVNLTTTGTDFAYDLYGFTENAGTWNTPTTSLNRGQGYIYRRSNEATLQFVGYANTGSVSVSLKSSCPDNDLKGFNLIGNPYPHAVAVSQPHYTLNPNGTWTAHESNIENPHAIADGEAFLVYSAYNNNPYYFSDVTPSTPGKGNTASASLAFTVSNGEYSDVAYARLEEGEGLPKIGHLTAEAPMLSIPVEGRRYAVANVGSDCESFDMVLRGVSGTYTLSFSGNSSYCHLVDRVAGKEIDMLRQPSYTFSSNGNDADRFMVKLSPEAAESADGNFVYWNGNVWMVEGNGSLQVFDVMGRQVMSFESVNTNIEIQNSQFPGTGVYVLRMGGKSQKIVVK